MKKNKSLIIVVIILAGFYNCLLGQLEIKEGDIIITEIMKNPKAVRDSKGEWFELFNAGSISININNWVIKDNGANSFIINKEGGLIINPGEYMVFGNNADSTENGGLVTDYNYSGFTLGNAEDEIIIFNEAEILLIDQVIYSGSDNWPDSEGVSMELKPDLFNYLDNDNGENWQSSTELYGDGDFGTPGKANSDNSSGDINIITQPKDQSVCTGETLILQIRAEGSYPISYIWERDDVEISGEIGPDLIISNITEDQSGKYKCILSSNGIIDESRTAIIDVLALPDPDLGPDRIFTNRPDTVVLDPGRILFNIYGMTDQSAEHILVNGYGWKRIEVSNGACFSTDSIFIGQVTGLEDQLLRKEVLIYPNPVETFLNIVLPENIEEKIDINIYSLSGKKVYTARKMQKDSNIQIMVNYLQKGFYFVIIRNQNNYFRARFMKI